MGTDSKNLIKIIGKAIFFASIQASIGSVEMSSKFSVINFSKDQETLQRAVDALKSYLFIGALWTLGTCFSLYASHGWEGALVGLIANLVMVGWIYFSYINAFKEAAKRYNLVMPTVLTRRNLVWIVVALLIVAGFIVIKS